MQCSRLLRQVRVVAIGVRDERCDNFARFDIDLVVRERGSGGPVALDHGDYVLYDISPTQPVEVVEHRWFRAQSS